ncbi:MbcA/ParS/Xre antitoxin family protein [Nostoc sp. CHAB 5834]|nr:MbcA/ParS/Xre antitoxin family protein [Nostoc sp. CHAB 5834]
MNKHLAQLLAVDEPPESLYGWHEVLTQGIHTSSLKALSTALGVTQMSLREFVQVGPGELKGERLNEACSCSMYRIADAYLRAKDKLGESRGRLWLFSQQPSLKGAVPIELLQSQLGTDYVLTAISRIE